jgi:hypothetical protein
MMDAMASLAMKKKAERRLRQLLAEDGFAQPDEVEYGRSSVTMFWHSVEKSVTVDVTDRGEIGETRMGPRSPKWDKAPADNGRVVRLATLREKREAERNVRAMLDDHGLPQPDYVEHGATCIRLFWTEEKVVMIVDIDDPPSDVDLIRSIAGRVTLGGEAS